MNIKIMIGLIIIILFIGCKQKIVEEAPMPVAEDVIEEVGDEVKVVNIRLTADRKMVPDSLDISAGTTVIWTNEGNVNRNLMIYDSSIKDLKEEDVVRSQNIAPGESFEYTFDKKGNYVVRDIYTGAMKGEITSSTVVDLEADLGIVSVK